MYESVAQANAVNDARRTAYNGGSLRFYSGARPANVAAGVSGTLLASLALAATAFAASSNRILTANAITAAPASATGTVGYAACFASNGTTLISLHSASLAGNGGEAILNSLTCTSGVDVSCSNFTISQPDGG
jgi:hypothetical protein